MAVFTKCLETVWRSGDRIAVAAAAPTQVVEAVPAVSGESGKNVTGYVRPSKSRRLDRWLDAIVEASGSEPAFLLAVACLVVWAFLGIPYGQTDDWAIIISNVQAIVSYLFDSLLMRQQLNRYDDMIYVAACLRSRNISQRRMIGRVAQHQSLDWSQIQHTQVGFDPELPPESLVGRVTTLFSKCFGHIISVGIFWLGVFIWLGFGPSMDWSDEWQLYINSATAGLMILIFSFLANIQERDAKYTARCLDYIFRVDSTIELKLRAITGDNTPNPTFVIPERNINRLQQVIFIYANIVGTLVGIAILIVVMVAWLAVGPVMNFNTDWWLMIGTYAGLVGLNDGFVLRNVQARLGQYEDEAFCDVTLDDMDTSLDQEPLSAQRPRCSISGHISIWMGAVCAHEITVVLGVLFILGLIAGASAMKWTMLGQLLCNIPPMIIESFFMLILITLHNISDSQRRRVLHGFYARRLRLLAYVQQLETKPELVR